MFDAIKTFLNDSGKNLVENKGVNTVTGAAVVASPDIMHVLMMLGAGVDVQAALAQGGVSMYLAGAIIVARFGIYIFNKMKK